MTTNTLPTDEPIFTATSARIALARDHNLRLTQIDSFCAAGLTIDQIRRILEAGEFTAGHATLDDALAALAAQVGCSAEQVRMVLEGA